MHSLLIRGHGGLRKAKPLVWKKLSTTSSKKCPQGLSDLRFMRYLQHFWSGSLEASNSEHVAQNQVQKMCPRLRPNYVLCVIYISFGQDALKPLTRNRLPKIRSKSCPQDRPEQRFICYLHHFCSEYREASHSEKVVQNQLVGVSRAPPEFGCRFFPPLQ